MTFVDPPRLTCPQDDGPVVVKTSGGASSGMMLAGLLASGQLDATRGDFAVFNNTSAEHPVTYDFTRRLARVCREDYGIPFYVVRFATYEHVERDGLVLRRATYQLETTESWRTDGTTFEEMLAKKRFLPSVHQRTCTVEMKIAVTERFVGDRLLRGWDVLPQQGHGGPPRFNADAGFADHRRRKGVSDRASYDRCQEFLNGFPTARPEQVIADFGGGQRVESVEPVDAYVSVIGFRGDEPRRVARMRDGGLKPRNSAHAATTFVAPLADSDMGITRAGVNAWWARQPEAIRPHYPPHLNVSNCTYCFLKGRQLIDLYREQVAWEATLPTHLREQCAVFGPHRLEWWLMVEERWGRPMPGYEKPLGFFHSKSSLTYQKIPDLAATPALDLDLPEIVCAGCTD